MSLFATKPPLPVHHGTMKTETWQKRVKHQVIAMKRSNYTNLTNSYGANSTFSASNKGNTVTYSSIISSNIPLYESPEVSFDEYLQDRPRVFKAVFPAHHRSNRLNEEEWKIQMVPIQFLFVSAHVVVVMRMRCKTHGKEYPSNVPVHATTVLELQATKWELRGLQSSSIPSDFTLCVKGTVYPERKEKQSLLKGHLEIGISLVRPPLLSLVPDNVLQGMAETILRSLAEEMKHSMNVSLPKDFNNFRRERLIMLQQSSHNSGSRTIDKLKRDS
ncbi:hypothetical protein LUZ63_018508 [Rhynchospora breviuscula]|uniref:Uncharacterized protein n=1 Tax=Rhynchospora breviuscula TaxID=2022672 RepID=A0A9Q0HIF6_9POAL|nr:hypothetical protein LUZ63_018508 [Rhynchospora breviuscula]